MFRFSSFCVLLMFFASCGGGGSSSSNPCSDLNVRVFGGERCDFSRSPVVAIVGFSFDGIPGSVCSATMVTVKDALTAAHCVSLASSPGGVGVFADGEFFPIVGGLNHPFYDGSADSPYDVAMITIGGVLDIGPVPLLVTDPLEVGERITVYGYGRNEEAGFIPQASDFRAGFMEIGWVSPFQFLAAFDSTGSAICQGDSGGPATQISNGVTSVVGVTSFTFRGCQEGSVSGFINVQNPEIYEFVRAYAPDVTIR